MRPVHGSRGEIIRFDWHDSCQSKMICQAMKLHGSGQSASKEGRAKRGIMGWSTPSPRTTGSVLPVRKKALRGAAGSVSVLWCPGRGAPAVGPRTGLPIMCP